MDTSFDYIATTVEKMSDAVKQMAHERDTYRKMWLETRENANLYYAKVEALEKELSDCREHLGGDLLAEVENREKTAAAEEMYKAVIARLKKDEATLSAELEEERQHRKDAEKEVVELKKFSTIYAEVARKALGEVEVLREGDSYEAYMMANFDV